ncbi:MAG: hypothetical protein JNK90_03910 [Planctomycetaceae bacterium]|nr:hypothetical protein [Planctomycetaceae bacterium]
MPTDLKPGRERNREDVNFVVEILEKGKPPPLRERGEVSRRAEPRRQFKIRISANPVVPEEELFECQTTVEMVEFIRRWFNEGEAIVHVPITIEAQ